MLIDWKGSPSSKHLIPKDFIRANKIFWELPFRHFSDSSTLLLCTKITTNQWPVNKKLIHHQTFLLILDKLRIVVVHTIVHNVIGNTLNVSECGSWSWVVLRRTEIK